MALAVGALYFMIFKWTVWKIDRAIRNHMTKMVRLASRGIDFLFVIFLIWFMFNGIPDNFGFIEIKILGVCVGILGSLAWIQVGFYGLAVKDDPDLKWPIFQLLSPPAFLMCLSYCLLIHENLHDTLCWLYPFSALWLLHLYYLFLSGTWVGAKILSKEN